MSGPISALAKSITLALSTTILASAASATGDASRCDWTPRLPMQDTAQPHSRVAKVQGPSRSSRAQEREGTLAGLASVLRQRRDAWVEYRRRFDIAMNDQTLYKKFLPELKEAVRIVTERASQPIKFLHAIKFVGTTGFALDWHGCFHKSTDGGLNWSAERLPLDIPLIGNLYKRLDVSAPDNLAFHDMDFVNESLGWVVGGSGILHTSDGGKNWIAQRGPFDLRSIDCAPNGDCWAGHRTGSVYILRTGKRKWKSQTTPAKGEISALYAVSGQLVYAASRAGEIIRTEDGGKSWHVMYQDKSTRFRGIHVIGRNLVWAVGAKGKILHSKNSGQVWTDQSKNIRDDYGLTKDDLRLHTVRFYDAEKGWAAGLFGTILGTTDGGQNWLMQRFEGVGNNRRTIYALHISGPKTIWAAGNTGNIIVSIDAGSVWFPVHGGLRILQEELSGTLKRIVQ